MILKKIKKLPEAESPKTICSTKSAFSGDCISTRFNIAKKSVTTLSFLRPSIKNC